MKTNKTEIEKIASAVVPHKRQIEYQNTELCAVVRFGLNTFTSQEDSNGRTEANAFFPTDFDADQWVNACKDAGMRGLILNCKHRDGFCLWPTEQTTYSVKSSPYLDGKSDIVKAVSESCKKAGLKFGINLYLCDRHEKAYFQGEKYDDFFNSLLEELLSNYGEIFEIQLDDTCEINEKRDFDFSRYYSTIRRLQPNAVIALCGPDVRWVGNDIGICRESEWSVVPEEKRYHRPSPNTPKSYSGKMDMKLGDLKTLKKAEEITWYPAEVSISLRKGWFFHKFEHMDLIPISKLKDIYLNSVGNNANLLVNIPADKRGLFHDDDVNLLKSFGADIKYMFAEKLEISDITSSSFEKGQETNNIFSEDGYWKSGENDKFPELCIKLKENSELHYLVLQENIATGQQIEAFTVYVKKGNKFKKYKKFTTVGHKKIVVFENGISSDEIKISIDKKRIFCTISNIELY